MRQDLRALVLQGASVVGGVAAALLVVGSARGTISFSPPATPEGYLVARADHYTLYAPSAVAVHQGEEEILHARQVFRRHFGAEPRDLVVFLADEPADFKEVELDALRRSGAGFLPFLTQKHLMSALPGHNVFALELGAELRSVDGTAQVVALADPGRAAAVGIQVGDVIAALNGSPTTDMASAARALQAIPAGRVVQLDVRREGGSLRLAYRKEERTGEERPNWMYADASARFIGQSKALAHEACHTFVAAYADDLIGTGRTSTRAYGHRALPDWFDEMAATLCESPELKARRRAQLRAKLDERIPLAEFARMEHPITPERLGRIIEAARGSDGLPVQFLRGPEVESVLDGTNSNQFYAQALSVGEFMFERGGDVVLQTVARHLVAGRSLDDALREVNRVTPSIPASVAEFEQQWLDWVVRSN